MAVNGEKFWARNQRRYKRYVVIPDVVISEIYCSMNNGETRGTRTTDQAPDFKQKNHGKKYSCSR